MSEEDQEEREREMAVRVAYGMALEQMAAGLRTRSECIDDLHGGAAKAASVAAAMLAAARMLIADREADFDHSVCVPLDYGALRKAVTDDSDKTVRRRRPMRP